MKIDYSKVNIQDLLCSCIHAQTEHLDCSKYGEEYEIGFELTEEEIENEDFCPMMNYCYPLEDEFKQPENIKDILNEAGAITLIRKTDNDRYYLALSGGGMDLSWDICRAYMLLGYLPPIRFCELPKFSGMNFKDIRNRKVIDACKKTAELAEGEGIALGKRLSEL